MSDPVDVSSCLVEEKTIKVFYTKRDLILYALGIGVTDLRYVYEDDSDFSAFPTFPIVLNFTGTEQDIAGFPSEAMMEANVVPPLPGVKFLLDGERFLEVLKPIPEDGGLFEMRSKVLGVHKKGKGALVESVATLERDGVVYCRITSGAFLVGAKGFKDCGKSMSKAVPVPNRAPDYVVDSQTSEAQAALYRLSGDYNPLHIDPSAAEMNGFPKPILHGLCTFGFAASAVLKAVLGNDSTKFRSIRVRFAKPVFPGETLVTKIWREGSKAIFNVIVKERNVVVVNNAEVEFTPSAKL